MHGVLGQTAAYLHDAHAGVEEYRPFGLLGDLLILVEVQIVRSIPQLSEVKVSSLERLQTDIKQVKHTQSITPHAAL